MPKLIRLVGLLLAGAGTAHATQPDLTLLWRTPGFANPESVALSADRKFLYVSNVDGEGDARDGNGSIAQLSLDGKMLERRWAVGLDAPKGLALRAGRLYVSDVTTLVELDSASGKILARHDAPDSGFLNDVAFAPDGSVLVSDSAKSRIYSWHDGRMQVWLQDELLRSVNGLLPEADRLVVVTMQGRLLAVDWKTRKITGIAEGLGEGDGIAGLGNRNYLVGEWPGRLFHVEADGKFEVLMDVRKEKHYLNDFLLIGDRLIVPNWEPGAVSAYRIGKQP
ncbi:MAG: SMP-30/gluconolactonase/LRE family protein [Luteimonas sp.]